MDIKEVTRVIKEKFPFRSLPTSMNVIVNKADLEKFMSLSNIDQETISAYTNYIFSYNGNLVRNIPRSYYNMKSSKILQTEEKETHSKPASFAGAFFKNNTKSKFTNSTLVLPSNSFNFNTKKTFPYFNSGLSTPTKDNFSKVKLSKTAKIKEAFLSYQSKPSKTVFSKYNKYSIKNSTTLTNTRNNTGRKTFLKNFVHNFPKTERDATTKNFSNLIDENINSKKTKEESTGLQTEEPRLNDDSFERDLEAVTYGNKQNYDEELITINE